MRHVAIAALALAACTTSAKFTELPPAESLAQHKAGAAFFDANNDDFREKNGVVPGAVMLDSSSKYDLAVLPADKDRPLVFYCSNRL